MRDSDHPTPGPTPGRLVGHTHYRFTRQLAKGGMGAVYEATQYGAEGFQKQVAIKTIIDSLGSDADFVEMFIGEAKLVADLVHENIIQVYQLDRTDNTSTSSWSTSTGGRICSPSAPCSTGC